MKRIKLLLCALLLVGLCACKENEVKVEDSIKIGMNLELSGDYADYGNEVSKGIELAVKQINANGGINGHVIELVKKDNKSKVKKAEEIQEELDEECIFTFGPATSKLAKAAASVSEDDNRVMILTSASEVSVCEDEDGEVLDHIYRVCFSDNYQGQALGNIAIKNGKTKATIISEEKNIYTSGLSASIKKTLESKNLIVNPDINYNSKDFNPDAIIEELNKNEYDVVYVDCYYQDSIALVNAIRNKNSDVMIVLNDASDINKITNDVKNSYLKNVYYSSQFDDSDSNSGAQEFVSAYKVEYNSIPTGFSAGGYDGMNYAMVLLNEIEDINSKSFSVKMSEYKKEYQGITSSFKMNKYHSPIKTIRIIDIGNNKVSTETFDK